VKNGGQRSGRTEQRNASSQDLDQKDAMHILSAIAREDATVPRAVAHELPDIARAVNVIVEAIASGGRLIYVGAGTSGRLAVLDAAEIPPTFGTSPRLVRAVIAGGRRALSGAAEGAEDDARLAKKDLAALQIGPRDAVVGLSASGTTPYVLGALQLARRRGARIIAVVANRQSPIARMAQIAIVPQTGPEVIAGSTRMKAGTAQKLVLNMLSTAAMVRLGHVYDNWMIDVALSNRKLRARGLQILEEASGAKSSDAKQALRLARNNLRVALIMLKDGVRAEEAARRLRVANGNLRHALGEEVVR
jgi:N-acetylmuramic acid 6-phosphate etherase